MRIAVSSKKYTREQVAAVVRAVKPANVTKFDLSIKGSQGEIAGRAYTKGCALHGSFAPLVVVRIGTVKYPYTSQNGGGYLPVRLFSDMEALVYVIAHELRHLWQVKVPRGWRVWGAKGKFSERDADAYAIHKVRQWRRGEI